MDAGLELFGTVGYANTSIRAVSSAASLNSRYFYESFTSREDLLYAVYQRIVDDILTRATEAMAGENALEAQARAGLRAGWTAVTEDRRNARIIAIEVVGVSERLELARRQNRHALAQLTADGAMSLAGGLRLRLDPVITARFLMGGVVELLGDWINGDLALSVDEVVEHFTALFTAAAYAALLAGRDLPGSGHASPKMRRDIEQSLAALERLCPHTAPQAPPSEIGNPRETS